VLLSHLVLFGFVYPGQRAMVPSWVMEDLIARLETEAATPAPSARLCRGTLLSRAQYLVDIEKWGYQDARKDEAIEMTTADITRWTEAISEKNRRREDHQ
jgi:hypothetical protein